MSEHTSKIKQKAIALGFHRVGIVTLPAMGQKEAAQSLDQWLQNGYQASMDWMQDVRRRQDVMKLMPNAKSMICVALNYYTPTNRESGAAKISRYGWGRDYHKVITRKLKALVLWISQEFDDVVAKYYVDTGPLQEKAWAQASGIGWIGKHANVITRDYGSWVFLGEVITNLELEADSPHTSHCGSCTRCLEACPTQAIVEPFVVDANRCIAYHTIENRAESIPVDIAKNMQRWVAGCDVCQDVCPWNVRFATETDVDDFQPYPWNVNPRLDELANLSDEDWDQRFRASALRRIRVDMMRRNAQANLDVAADLDG